MNLPPLERRLGASAGPLPDKTMVDWFDASLEGHSEAFKGKHAYVNAPLLT